MFNRKLNKPKPFCDWKPDELPDHCQICNVKLASNELYHVRATSKFMCFECLNQLVNVVNEKKGGKDATSHKILLPD